MLRALFLIPLLGCGTVVDLGGTGAPDGSVDATICGTLVAPTTPANCFACYRDASGCQPNGCYGGYWCNVDAGDCRYPPSSCP